MLDGAFFDVGEHPGRCGRFGSQLDPDRCAGLELPQAATTTTASTPARVSQRHRMTTPSRWNPTSASSRSSQTARAEALAD